MVAILSWEGWVKQNVINNTALYLINCGPVTVNLQQNTFDSIEKVTLDTIILSLFLMFTLGSIVVSDVTTSFIVSLHMNSWEISLLKSMLIDKDFQTWLLRSWQHTTTSQS